MSDELSADVRPVVDFFGLPNTAVVAKDFHVVRAIRARCYAFHTDLQRRHHLGAGRALL
mgnify:CR=1 FL=1